MIPRPRKVCPLLLLVYALEDKGCLGVECAWWNGSGEECGMRTLASQAQIAIWKAEGV